MSDAERILMELACSRQGCACHASVRLGRGLTHCPVHGEDSRPSLNVTPDEALKPPVKVFCHSCGKERQDEILGALRDRGLWDGRVEPDKRHVSATYDYLGRNGELVFQVVRYSPKGFSQRRLVNNEWVNDISGVQKTLYRLPEVLKASSEGKTIYVVEGEKDADVLWHNGLSATTSPGGAGKWAESYSADLAGANVVVIADKDAPGRKHAQQVATGCELAARSIKVLELPGEGVKDSSDWFTSGGSITDFEKLAEAAPLWVASGGRKILTARDLANQYREVLSKRKAKDPEAVGLATGINELDVFYQATYRRGDLWLIVAPTGVGKTAMLQTLQGHLDRQGMASMFVSVEQPWVQLVDRMMSSRTGFSSWKLLHGDLTDEEQAEVDEALKDLYLLPRLLVDDPSLTTEGLEALIKVAKAQGVLVVFVDYAQRLADRVGDSEYARVSVISDRLTRIARTTGVCIVAAAQVSRKGARPSGEPAQLSEIRESGHLEEDASVVLVLGRQEGKSEAKLAIRKNRHGPTGILNMHFDQVRTRFVMVSKSSGPTSETQKETVAAAWVKD